jgi:hypothetical protein
VRTQPGRRLKNSGGPAVFSIPARKGDGLEQTVFRRGLPYAERARFHGQLAGRKTNAAIYYELNSSCGIMLFEDSFRIFGKSEMKKPARGTYPPACLEKDLSRAHCIFAWIPSSLALESGMYFSRPLIFSQP